MSFEKTFLALLAGKSLTETEAGDVFAELFRNRLTPHQAKSLLLLLAKKGETAEEVLGCLRALKPYEPQGSIHIPGLIDTCGTGGDGSHSLNISTLAAIVAAGAGCKVAKHGNRAFSSKCGSSDLMEAFGVQLEASPSSMIESIRRNGIGYFHAPNYHPTIGKFQALRKSLGTKTIFNLLGPLINPFKLSGQLVGVANEKTFDLYTAILKKQAAKRTLLVFSAKDGMDEISTTHSTKAVFIDGVKAQNLTINPITYKLRRTSPGDLRISSIEDSQRKSDAILKGIEKGPIIDAVLVNAGAAIWMAGKSLNLEEGIHQARVSIQSGNAYKALKGLIESSK